jgi:hypothetical protein
MSKSHQWIYCNDDMLLRPHIVENSHYVSRIGLFELVILRPLSWIEYEYDGKEWEIWTHNQESTS